MRARSLRVPSLVFVAALAGLSACGGGSGGASTPTIPGTLTSIALEGATAPGTGGGSFGPFGALTTVDVADGGWTAFVADIVGGTTTRGLFVQRPDGTVVDVFLKGQAMPAPNGSGTIDDFGRIWMSPGATSGGFAGGIVTAYVELSGGTVEGIVSARVPAAAAPTEKSGVMSRGFVLPVGAVSQAVGALSLLDDDLIEVDDFGDVFFVGVGTGGMSPLHGVWTVSRLGTLADNVAVTNDPRRRCRGRSASTSTGWASISTVRSSPTRWTSSPGRPTRSSPRTGPPP